MDPIAMGKMFQNASSLKRDYYDIRERNLELMVHLMKSLAFYMASSLLLPPLSYLPLIELALKPYQILC